MHTPTPAEAVVPQFYGYDVPTLEEEEIDDRPLGLDRNGQISGKGSIKKKYLSPMLLLEDCGNPIDIDKLSGDKK